ncbi:glycine--tRNA ligase subunit beta [Convivina praedatoris]|uniref:Glycine--tRNA ligase beta subunit n=1 Tax=Convivina praedatoris TaxID=2880963 RepID=A0ABN8H9D2_9LACO|nr:glycine--tRNA ligase subunit beta [Convivina sp. LMG 32447]CAH1852147.1 Glycine--tRNA ligase beta subunit [Convivina sp. LMG 32447]CAH1853795.1 Glycine--tRNA ligase beta subunit [Convivina sp. LMG 32447]CAH1854288.1 Glycine--tRNA ligase beta subunit [Convivina sp. LMG 32447]
MATFILEIGLEEVPAHLVTSSEEQLLQRVRDFMADHRLSYGQLKGLSTPRRLAVQITDLAAESESISEEKRGPAIERAKDADGNWSKAAQGFARGQGTTPENLMQRDGYVWFNKVLTGEPAADILAKLGDEVVMQMKFTTYMKWGNHDFLYVRPIRWLVAMLDQQVIDFSVLDVKTGNTTRGHRFLSSGDVVIPTASDYEQSLEQVFVLADAQTRKQKIMAQLMAIAQENNWQLDLDSEAAQDLLEEVNNIVEWPTAFAGNFADKYLALPKEVLITSMREHQRFFFVTDQAGDLLPHFLSVRNGNGQHLANVIAGNEKVLVARLEDAEFFYQEDQQKTIADYMERVKKLVFHEKIGTVYEHMQRVGQLAAMLAQYLQLSADETKALQRAAQIYKFDLMTGMVGEFDELQGVMGEHYAKLFGEEAAVGQAIREHYLPISADGTVAQSNVGAVLALADKLDTIVTFFAADMVPTGSNDPYGLRRAASGIVRTLESKGWQLDLLAILSKYKQNNLPVADTNLEKVIDFMTDRLRKQALDQGIRADIVSAGTANVVTGNFVYVADRTQVLSQHADDANFRAVIEALTRVSRLAAKQPSDAAVEPDLLVNGAEKQLYSVTQGLNLQDLIQTGAQNLFEALAGLKAPIAAYFEATMVNDDDQAIRANRYAQLNQISRLINGMGDLEEIVIK